MLCSGKNEQLESKLNSRPLAPLDEDDDDDYGSNQDDGDGEDDDDDDIHHDHDHDGYDCDYGENDEGAADVADNHAITSSVHFPATFIQ